MMSNKLKSNDSLLEELEQTRQQLYEALDTLEAIRTGQVDALIVQDGDSHQLYTLESADHAYRVFIEQMTEGAVTLTRDGMIAYSNSQFASMVGRPLSSVIGSPFQDVITRRTRAVFEKLFQTCWTEDCKGEVELLGNSRSIPVQLSITVLRLKEGDSLSIILTDLTDQKIAQVQLEEKNKEMAYLNRSLEASNNDLLQFASVASHDLQEPLRKIQMYVNLMIDKRKANFSEEDMKYLNKMLHSAARMKTLIIDVLNYSRLSAHDTEFAETDLNDLLSDVMDDFEFVIEQKGAKINIEGPLPVLQVNPGQIRQVFQNLISNALKFSKADEAPEIEIIARRLQEKDFDSDEQGDGQFCLISIKDHGIGFDEKFIPSIFALFERLNPKDQYEGTGIGLAITQKILKKHDGLIRVKSKQGVGSEFQIILPLSQSK